MPFYVYVPNGNNGTGGYVSASFPEREKAECEAAVIGGDARVIETPKPTFGHLMKYKEAGYRKCESCGGIVPPWRQKTKTEEVKG